MKALANLLRLARPGHWIKNLFVFAPVIFDRRFTDPVAVLESAGAFVAFSLAASAVYALNDVCDRSEDSRHPTKRRRPVASGAVTPTAASVLALVLASCAAVVAMALGPAFSLWLTAYLVIMLGYVLGLKRAAILDVLILAVGFVIRACAGGAATGIPISPWLILCTLTLALFLGFAKREGERQALGAAAAETRAVEWSIYDQKSLEHMMTVSATLAIVTYMLYTVSARTIADAAHPWMIVTVLPVVYGVFRFYRMAVAGRAADPVDMVRRDPAFVLTVAVWLAMVAAAMVVLPKAVLP